MDKGDSLSLHRLEIKQTRQSQPYTYYTAIYREKIPYSQLLRINGDSNGDCWEQQGGKADVSDWSNKVTWVLTYIFASNMEVPSESALGRVELLPS